MPLVTRNSQKGFSGSEEYGEGTKPSSHWAFEVSFF